MTKTDIPDKGEIIIYTPGIKEEDLTVHLVGETVWLTQAQMGALFQRDQSVISRHVNNVFKEGELERKSNMQKMHITNSDKPVSFYNLDVIISVGYRVKSQRGTQFRIWATKILKEHLVKGFTTNQQRLAEKGLAEAQQVLTLLSKTLREHHLVSNEGLSVLQIVSGYASTWRILLQYDENVLPVPDEKTLDSLPFSIISVRQNISLLKRDLLEKGEATELFGNERSEHLEGIIGSVFQTFDGHDLYPSLEEKAANLLYFVIKDHPFTDGNKRIGAFLFLLFLEQNELLHTMRLDNNALVALTLLTATSDPSQKEIVIKLIVNLLFESKGVQL
ncbi:virulence protein RhuM/Fic/DOC family protein [Desulfogranum japonicum]|uniref:virulence protein RhuM/Fic/DOC family protein n=1 Tax=Desulfogranum japonicum TaxID=231447 RepID=UPI0003F79959|nr:virulence protein RhuM/Fic/DOC family protein [Desulfogranum japonicum]